MTNVMKKVVAGACAAVMVLGFAACSGGKSNEDTTKGPSGNDVGGSVEEIVKEYVTAYDKTKAANTLTGSDSLEIVEGTLKMGGSSNAMLDKLVTPLVGQLFQAASDKGLPPNGEEFATSKLTAADVESATKEETDTSYILKITPKESSMSQKGQDAQGRFFDVLGDIGAVVEDMGVTWASGSTAENCKVIYNGGQGVITIDKESGMITDATYTMMVNVDVTHATLAFLKDKAVAAQIKYVQTFPVAA